MFICQCGSRWEKFSSTCSLIGAGLCQWSHHQSARLCCRLGVGRKTRGLVSIMPCKSRGLAGWREVEARPVGWPGGIVHSWVAPSKVRGLWESEPRQLACLALEGILSRLIASITPTDAKRESGTFLSLRSCVATLMEKKERVAGWDALYEEVQVVHDILNAPTIQHSSWVHPWQHWWMRSGSLAKGRLSLLCDAQVQEHSCWGVRKTRLLHDSKKLKQFKPWILADCHCPQHMMRFSSGRNKTTIQPHCEQLVLVNTCTEVKHLEACVPQSRKAPWTGDPGRVILGSCQIKPLCRLATRGCLLSIFFNQLSRPGE